MLNKIIKNIISTFAVTALLLSFAWINSASFVKAEALNTLHDTLSIYKAGETGVTHTISFNAATTSDIQQINIRFATDGTGTTKPANLDISAATLGIITGLGAADWSLNLSSQGTGSLKIQSTSAVRVNSGDEVSINLNNITNHLINDCQPGNDTLTDTCYVQAKTYSDAGETEIDSGYTTYTVEEDPLMSLEVVGITSGQTHNGITTTNDSTSTKLEYGLLSPGSAKYAAHQLAIRTNAPHGYKVYAKLADGFRGSYYDTEIDPFGATNATWTTPQYWSSPDGTAANINTGWFGANTTDIRVAGWSGNTSGKFGPFSSIAHLVAQSDGPDKTGSTIYVSYAVEINSQQPADQYMGEIIYDVQTNY